MLKCWVNVKLLVLVWWICTSVPHVGLTSVEGSEWCSIIALLASGEKKNPLCTSHRQAFSAFFQIILIKFDSVIHRGFLIAI